MQQRDRRTVWARCERGNRRIAFHPQCHLDVHEERGYAHLHELHADLLGSRERLPTLEDLEAVREPLAAVVLELPAREIGGQLPAWEELTAFCTKAHDEGIALHMDGARLWQCAPFYHRTLAEIADLFDTVYVSFCKDLGAPAGAALTGTKVVVDEARVWQVRHGGRLFTAYPFLIAAERGLDEVLPRMPEFVARANELAAALGALDGVEIVPDPPHTAMFHLLVHHELGPLNKAASSCGGMTQARGATASSLRDPTHRDACRLFCTKLSRRATEVAPRGSQAYVSHSSRGAAPSSGYLRTLCRRPA
jgi:threonine aldolase